jgi:predicted PolB exonuclease-like 3'-5' exonuclease
VASDYVFIDLETIPCASEADVPPVRAPRRWKDPEKIAAYIAEREPTAWRDTSLDPLVGRILCIGVAVNEGEPVVIHEVDADGQPDERAMLVRLAEVVPETGPVWVGHNLAAFDLRWIYYRARKFGLPFADRVPFDKWSKRVQDTADLALGPNPRGDTIGLEALARFFGLPGKPDDVSGADVWDLWRAGRVAEILDYCAGDVRMTREVHRALMFGVRQAPAPVAQEAQP